MNSLLQQLYHVPGFSLQLLGLVPDRRGSKTGGDGGSGAVAADGQLSYRSEDDDVLQQLQVRL